MVTQKRIFTFLWFKVQLEIVLFVSLSFCVIYGLIIITDLLLP